MRLIVLLLFTMSVSIQANANTMDEYTPLQGNEWRLITDNVMGGISRGKITSGERMGKTCILMTGDVSTDNNGGFIQIALDVDESTAEKASGHDGVRIEVMGNGEAYNVHLRTRDLWFPWQAYRSTFNSTGAWRYIDLPFDRFTAYKTSARLDVSKIKRIGVVAIGRDFAAELCVAGVGFYKNDIRSGAGSEISGR